MTTLSRTMQRVPRLIKQNTHRVVPSLMSATSRLTDITQHIQPVIQSHFTTQRNFTTTTKMSSPNNNDQFKLDALFNVKGKVVLVTGGGSGIGLMATQAFAVNGSKVYIVGRTLEKLETVAKEFGKDVAGQIIPMQGDITDKKDIDRMYNEIKSKEKHIDILVNNAGISSNTLQTEAKSADEMRKNLFEHEDSHISDWMDTYKTNVPQIFFMTTAFLPLLQASSDNNKSWSASVINICSISGIVKTAQHHFAYNASKAAVIHVNKMLAWEVANNGLKIRINSIAPGVFPSEMTAGESGDNQKSELPKEKYEGKVPANRPGNDRDMGNAMLFVATNQYVNGQAIVVDGGYVLQAGTV